MTTPSSVQVYTQGTGTSGNSLFPIYSQVAPTTSDNQWPVGKLWINQADNAVYMLTSVTTAGGVKSGNWIGVGGGSADVNTLSGNTGTAIPASGNIQIAGTGGLSFAASGAVLTGTITAGTNLIATLTGDSGGAISPLSGNITVAGTANQITTTGTANTVTCSLPSAITAPGSLATTTSLTAGNGFNVTTGAISMNSGTSSIAISSDAANTTIGVGTGAGVKSLVVGSQTGNSSITLQSGSGAINLTSYNTGGIILDSSAGGDMNIFSGVGTINISADAAITNLNLGTGGAVKTVAVGSTNTTSVTTLQSGTGGLNIQSNNGDMTIVSGTGAINIGTDATDMTTTIGSTTGASALLLQNGSSGIQATGPMVMDGSLTLNTVGSGLRIATGANATIGTSGAMVAGDVTVANTSVTANSIIFAIPAALGTVTRPQAAYVSSITPSTSFVLRSQDATDTSTWYYLIIN